MIKNIRKKEMIGLNAEITDSKNKSNIGISGKIINETKHTFAIRTQKGKKTVFKKNITIKITSDSKKISIDGKLLIGKPEERIKK